MLPDIGFTEIIVVGLVALFILKPDDFPKLMKQLGMLSVTLRANFWGMWEGWQEQVEKKAPVHSDEKKKF
jgi:Sec-independent protein translocase protein TatA